MNNKDNRKQFRQTGQANSRIRVLRLTPSPTTTEHAGERSRERRKPFVAETLTGSNRPARTHTQKNIRRPIHSQQGSKQGQTTSASSTHRPPQSRDHKGRPRRDSQPKQQHHKQSPKDQKDSLAIPPIEQGVLRVIPLGGVEVIGQNMTAIEYGNDILVIDAGLQFSEVETPGIDFILPNTRYLEDRKDKIRAMLITHGHLDHIGAIPYVMEKIGNPPIYSRQFGAIMIQKRQQEFPHITPLTVRTVEGTERMQFGEHFTVTFFPISHAIPDSVGMLIETPLGTIGFISDVRVEHKDGVPIEEEFEQYRLFKDKKILLMTLESTRIERPGFSLPESVANATIEEIIKNTPSRLIIGTFASQVERIIHIIKVAKKYDKYVFVDGRAMKGNVEIIRHLNLVDMSHVLPIEEILDYPPHRVVVVATGAQGEEYSVFDRIANKTHKYIKLGRADTVVFSSSIIPGNEYSITKLKDNLYRQEAKIVTYLESDVHAGGHGYGGELAWIHKQIDYKFFMPVHGHHYMLRIHADMAESLGTPRENIVIPNNGSIIEIYDGGEKIRVREERAPSSAIMVDGFSIGGEQEVVLRDRQALSEDGIFVVVVSVNPKTGKLRKSPDIISRGFIYLKEQQDLLNTTRNLVKKTVEDMTQGMNPINFEYVKSAVTDTVRKYLFQKTAKSPIVIPVVIGV